MTKAKPEQPPKSPSRPKISKATSKQALDLLNKGIARLAIKNAFFTLLIYKLTTVEKPEVKTILTNGKEIAYNPDYIIALCPNGTIDNLIGVLAKKVLHIVFMHVYRMHSRDLNTWRIACTYVVNKILKDNGFSLPPKHLSEPAFDKMTEEQVYNYLVQNADQMPSAGAEELAEGYFMPAEKDDSANWEAAVKMSNAVSKAQGKQSALMDLVNDRLFSNKVNWRDVLANFFQSTIRDGRRWERPNRRWSHLKISLPEQHRVVPDQFLFAVDTSGSIHQDELNVFIAEMFNCLDLYSEQCNGEETLDIIWCDSKIARMEKIARGANVKPAGGGGTSFAPVTNYLVEHDGEYSGLIYFTDGYCDDFGTNPNIPCIWLLPAPCKSFDPPFGATVVFND